MITSYTYYAPHNFPKSSITRAMPSRLPKMVKAMQREKTIYLQGFMILGYAEIMSTLVYYGLIDPHHQLKDDQPRKIIME